MRMPATFRSPGVVKEDMETKMNTRARTFAGLLTLTLFLGGCGSPGGGAAGSGGGGAGSDEPVAGAPGSGSGGGGEVVSPRPGMAEVHPVKWDKVRLAEDGRSLWFRWWSGVEPCNVLDHVEVRISQHVVLVTLFEGKVPGKEDVVCPEMAQLKEVKVTLAKPLDGKRSSTVRGWRACGTRVDAGPDSPPSGGVR
ncbi:MAG: hypothetical protein H0T12_02355 [Actinobacteria bacterium]|nr:hypothetical protein [Actinomycetota bacterium]